MFAASQPSLPDSPDPVEDDGESMVMPDFIESKPKKRVSTMKKHFMVERRLRRLRGIRMRQVLEQIDAPELLKTAFLSQTSQGTPGSGVASTNDGNDKTADNDASSTQKENQVSPSVLSKFSEGQGAPSYRTPALPWQSQQVQQDQDSSQQQQGTWRGRFRTV